MKRVPLAPLVIDCNSDAHIAFPASARNTAASDTTVRFAWAAGVVQLQEK